MVVYQAQGQLKLLLNEPLGLILQIYDNIFHIIAYTAITQEIGRLMT
jgi:hypothetical protein